MNYVDIIYICMSIYMVYLIKCNINLTHTVRNYCNQYTKLQNESAVIRDKNIMLKGAGGYSECLTCADNSKCKNELYQMVLTKEEEVSRLEDKLGYWKKYRLSPLSLTSIIKNKKRSAPVGPVTPNDGWGP